MKQVVLFIACIIMLKPAFAQEGDQKLIAVVEEMAETFEKLVPEKKLEEIMEIYSDDAIYGPENNGYFKGKDEIRKAWTQTFTYEIADFNMEPVSVYGDKNLIYEAGLGYSVIRVNEKERRFNFKYVNVWRKEKDGYKLVIDTYNAGIQEGM